MVPARPDAGEVTSGKTKQPAPIELSDDIKKTIESHVKDGWSKEDSIDFLLESETYEDETSGYGGLQSYPALIAESQQKLAEDYYDSLSKPKTAEPTEVLDEDQIINKEKPSGAKTSQTQQAEEKGQEAPTATAVEPTADEDAATQKRLLAAVEKARKQLRKDENLATGDPKLEASKKRYEDAQKAWKDFLVESEPRSSRRY